MFPSWGVCDFSATRRDWDLGANLALEAFKFVKFGGRSPGIPDSLVCRMAKLLALEAGPRVKLHLETLARLWLTPLGVNALVLITVPRISWPLGQLEPAGSQPFKGDGNPGNVTLLATAQREPDRVRNRCQRLRG